MKLNEKQIEALKLVATSTNLDPVTVVGNRKAGGSALASQREISDSTARALVRRGLVTTHPRRAELIHEEDYVEARITDDGKQFLVGGLADEPAPKKRKKSEPTASTVVVRYQGLKPKHENCAQCLELSERAREVAMEHGADQASYPAGEHEGSWSK